MLIAEEQEGLHLLESVFHGPGQINLWYVLLGGCGRWDLMTYLDHLPQSSIPTCYQWTHKRSNSASAFLLEAYSSYNIRQYEVYVDLCFTLYWVIWSGKVLKAILHCLGTFQRILKPRFWWQSHLWTFSINLTFRFLEFIVFIYFYLLFS